MKAVLTRVKSASVRAHGQVCGEIQAGFLILLGIGPDDTEKECKKLAEKALGLRIFEDADGKMNLGLQDVGGLQKGAQAQLFKRRAAGAGCPPI